MSKKTTPATPWPNIEELIDNGGNVSIGDIPPVPCAAVAADESIMLAALLRREGESLIELLGRLDDAIGKAFDEEFYTDEINA
ncbi:MAG: hypothetical protein KC425_26850 [Anaerolineales bacterium]|nr:hypothetical protein [Anaerolineales bacterium]